MKKENKVHPILSEIIDAINPNKNESILKDIKTTPKHTAGKWVQEPIGDGRYTIFNPSNKLGIGVCYTKEDAQLIAEAGNVANETGLTPRQLLEQHNELLEALKIAEKIIYRDKKIGNAIVIDLKKLTKIIDETLDNETTESLTTWLLAKRKRKVYSKEEVIKLFTKFVEYKNGLHKFLEDNLK